MKKKKKIIFKYFIKSIKFQIYSSLEDSFILYRVWRFPFLPYFIEDEIFSKGFFIYMFFMLDDIGLKFVPYSIFEVNVE